MGHARLGVTPRTRHLVSGGERTEIRELHVTAVNERREDFFKNRFHNGIGFRAGKTHLVGENFREVHLRERGRVGRPCRITTLGSVNLIHNNLFLVKKVGSK